ncbi:MAG: FG-GAP-like repeat-containing protein, partial [Candidatus Thermoplasmatota archaeon]|nr:FG-GAP-like repeat-containing protein [Candidatus Thermoplasmatota archaeon]
MAILTTSLLGNKRTLALAVVLVMGLVAFAPLMQLIWTDGPVDTADAASPLALKPGQRKGDHYIDTSPSEYMLAEQAGSAYYGSTMDKIDWNKDGVLDLIVTSPGRSGGRLYIYDGSYQVKFPNLFESGATARWTFTGSSKFGVDFSFGDVNGDGWQDMLIMSDSYSSPQGFLYYGGPWVNSMSTFSTANATFGLLSYCYYGGFCTIGDMDGDGYGDVFVGNGGYYYEYTYPPGYSYWYKYYYGEARWWFGSTTLKGHYDYYTSAGVLWPPKSFEYDYGTYGYSYHYSMLGNGGAAAGDMNGDGRDEIAIGSPYDYQNNNYYVGSTMVIYPKSTIRSWTGGTSMQSSPHVDWVAYTGANYFDAVGGDPQMVDYNGDGLMDLTFNTGWYSYGTYADNGKYCWMIDGSTTIPTGYKSLGSASNYNRRFYATDAQGFGSHAFGDFDGDGKMDIALGDKSPGTVYILLNDQFVGKSGSIEVSKISVFTVHAPSGAQRFAYPCEYYRYYYYAYNNKFRTICLWNRDSDGLDDLFVSDHYATYKSYSQAGVVYGISNYPMFGIGRFDATGADPPNSKTLYAEHRSYGFKGSAWNKWNLFGT